jgi:hypothetical protein
MIFLAYYFLLLYNFNIKKQNINIYIQGTTKKKLFKIKKIKFILLIFYYYFYRIKLN